MMTSSVAQRRGASFTIAELIGTDSDDDDDDAAAGNHDNDNNNSNTEVTPPGNAVERDCGDIHQVAWQHEPTTGAFHVYRPSSVANNNFYQACLNWMRSRGMIVVVLVTMVTRVRCGICKRGSTEDSVFPVIG